jgi:hypothetical protein
MPLFFVLRGDIYPIAVFLSIKISLKEFDFQGTAEKHAFGAENQRKISAPAAGILSTDYPSFGRLFRIGQDNLNG